MTNPKVSAAGGGEQTEQGIPPPATVEEFAALLDYPVGPAILTIEQVAGAVRRAASLGLASVSVPSGEADLAVRLLAGTQTAAAALVGYPYGSASTAAKLYEARDLLRRGVKEIEFVVNLGKLASREFQYIESELLQVSRSCQEHGALLKVVVEAPSIAEDLKVIACKITKRVEAGMIVSSAYPAAESGPDTDVELLKRVSKEVCGIVACASGLDQALGCQQLGCVRIRSSAPELILASWKSRLDAAAKPSAGAPS
jgi:deoxyribose-phosphate aldolase